MVKRITGRERHLGTDTLGLQLTVLVTAASPATTSGTRTAPPR
ncbi:hypothetical protein GCM10010365_57790 [Streptomyces poonensis]|uniref:Uncharacterized protein n=1 Tax=Streptomyces poonensis TaxID=68255 RepID=A0A918Q1E6_9ACTN|nr:hypothetical protein GCM10010365_57790 [Streptomyces poonensis]